MYFTDHDHTLIMNHLIKIEIYGAYPVKNTII